jgi:hypothetical protein
MKGECVYFAMLTDSIGRAFLVEKRAAWKETPIFVDCKKLVRCKQS